MNEREIERKLAELLSSRGNILPGFSSNGGQQGDQIMVSLDGIRDAVQGLALTSIPPGKIGAVFDKSLQQWFILSNEKSVVVRQDKVERQHKEKRQQPDSTIKIPPTNEYPKLLILYKDSTFDTKLYEYNKRKFEYQMVLEKINFELLKARIAIKKYFEQDYFLLEDIYIKDYVFYLDNIENSNTIKDKYKKCSGQNDVGSGNSGSGSQSDPYISEDIRKMDEIIKAHPGYKFNIYWASKQYIEDYSMGVLAGLYLTTIKEIHTAEASGSLTPLSPTEYSVYETGGTYNAQIVPIKTPENGPQGPYFIACPFDYETNQAMPSECEAIADNSFREIIYYNVGSIFIFSNTSSVTSSLTGFNIQNNYNGSVSGRECIILDTSLACWVTVTGTYTYSYNYKISGFQVEPPTDPDLTNDNWPDDSYLGGDGSTPPGGWVNVCDYPTELENIFNIYKIYFYFKKQQYSLDIKCRSKNSQQQTAFYSTYTLNKKQNPDDEDSPIIEHNYDIITQKIIQFNPTSETETPNNYKLIYIDLFYFDENKEEVHNLTLFKYYHGFNIPYDINNNLDWFIETFIPWEYKIYNKHPNNNKFIYNDEDVVYYNKNLQVIFIEGSYKPTLIGVTIPPLFEDWETIIENDWRRNISQIYPIINNSGDTECIRNIRDSNYVTFISTNEDIKKGDVIEIPPDQLIKQFDNKPLSELIFTNSKKIPIKRTNYDYLIEDNQCSLDNIGYKTLNIDGIGDLDKEKYSLEAIVYSKVNNNKET